MAEISVAGKEGPPFRGDDVVIRIAVAGVRGRMGRRVLAAVLDSTEFQLTGALVRPGDPDRGKDAALIATREPAGVILTDDPATAFAATDAIIDFTTPAVSCTLAEFAARAGVAHVIGTTGFSAEQEETIRLASKKTPIVKSGNMSVGVSLLTILTANAAKALPAFDAEILEMHHRMKVDAPSGTALLLAEAIAQGRKVSPEESAISASQGRTGTRHDGKIGFASLRGGTVVGEHKVIFAGPHERVILAHIAEDRSIFAQGALAAARWAHGKNAGLYSMLDVLDLA